MEIYANLDIGAGHKTRLMTSNLTDKNYFRSDQLNTQPSCLDLHQYGKTVKI